MVWHVAWIGLVSILVLAVIAALRTACFGTGTLFKARENDRNTEATA